MATTQIAPLLVQSFKDSNGNPLAGGLLYTYAAGTLTLQNTFTDSTGTTANANPIVLNNRGEAAVWLSAGLAYKFILYDFFNTLIYTVDQVTTSSAPTTLNVSGGGTGATTSPQALINLGFVTKANGSSIIPSGTTAQRDAAPVMGYLRYNATLAAFEGYNGTAWGSVGGSTAGASFSDLQSQTATAFTTAGTSTAYTLTTLPVAATLIANQYYQVTWHASNTTVTPTLTRDGLAVQNIKVYDITGAKVAPPVGAFGINTKTDLVYDGVDFVAVNFAPVMPVSFSGNGYLKLPNGLIFQWISGAVAAGGTQFNYPITFPNGVFFVGGTNYPNNTAVYMSTYGGTNSIVFAVAFNSSGASTASNFNVLAIGY